jgi:hypothetical protein
MKLNISIEDLNQVISAVKTCPTIEPDEIEKILSPIRAQLDSHHTWNKRKQMVMDYVKDVGGLKKDVETDYASECPYKLEPEADREDMHVINTYFDDDGVKHTKEYYTQTDRNRPFPPPSPILKNHIE